MLQVCETAYVRACIAVCGRRCRGSAATAVTTCSAADRADLDRLQPQLRSLAAAADRRRCQRMSANDLLIEHFTGFAVCLQVCPASPVRHGALHRQPYCTCSRTTRTSAPDRLPGRDMKNAARWTMLQVCETAYVRACIAVCGRPGPRSAATAVTLLAPQPTAQISTVCSDSCHHLQPQRSTQMSTDVGQRPPDGAFHRVRAHPASCFALSS